MKAGGEGVVTLLQHSFQQGERLRQVALRVIVQFSQAVVHAFRQDLLQEAACLSHTLCQLARLLHHSFGAGYKSSRDKEFDIK